MFRLMDKKIIAILRIFFSLTGPMIIDNIQGLNLTWPAYSLGKLIVSSWAKQTPFFIAFVQIMKRNWLKYKVIYCL